MMRRGGLVGTATRQLFGFQAPSSILEVGDGSGGSGLGPMGRSEHVNSTEVSYTAVGHAAPVKGGWYMGSIVRVQRPRPGTSSGNGQCRPREKEGLGLGGMESGVFSAGP